jgi:uncharacterized membrane protein
MQTALVVLLICAAIDLILCAILLAVVWVEHRRQQKRAAAAGEPVKSAAGQFGCLIAFGVVGFVVLYGTAWLLLRG